MEARVKMDYLRAGSDDCPFIRLYDFRSMEIQRLREAFESLASGTAERVVLRDVEPVDGTQLTFTRAARDSGVVESGPHSLDVALTPEGWQRCIRLLEPFSEPSSGHQWLCEDVGRIRLLVSRDGSW